MKRLLLLVVGVWLVSSLHLQASDTLVVGYSESPPFIFTEQGEVRGINYWLWEHLAQENNLQYRLQPMVFDSMLVALQEGRIHLSLNPLTLTSERSRRFEFTQPYFASHSAVAVTEPPALQKFFNLLTSFLDSNFLRGMMVLLAIILAFGYLGWLFERRHNHEQFRPGWRGIWDGFWWSAVTLTTVGYGDKAPRTRWGKIAALALMFGGMLFISGLTAGIASSLTVDQLATSSEDLDDFRDKSVGTLHNSSTFSFLQTHYFGNLRPYPTVQAGVEGLQNGEVDALMHDEPILKYYLRKGKNPGRVILLPMKFDPQFYGFGMANGQDSLRLRLSSGILHARESPAWQIILSEYGLSDF